MIGGRDWRRERPPEGLFLVYNELGSPEKRCQCHLEIDLKGCSEAKGHHKAVLRWADALAPIEAFCEQTQ